MNYLIFFDDFNTWIKNYWGTIIFLFVLLIFLIIISHIVIKSIWVFLKNKKFKKNNIDVDKKIIDEIGIFLGEFNLKIVSLKYVKDGPNKILAWRSLIEILTKVIANTFDEDGSEKKVLDSIYEMFKSIRNDMKDNVGAISTVKVLLILLNQTLRPFLAKWDKLINEKKIFEIYTIDNKNQNEGYQKKFQEDYETLLEKIKKEKYIESLCHLCGIHLKNIKKYTYKGKSTPEILFEDIKKIQTETSTTEDSIS